MRVPFIAIVLGVLGLIPFAVCSLLSVTGDPTVTPRAVVALIGYGAIILGFVGGVHWGFAMPVMPALEPVPLPPGPSLPMPPHAVPGVARRLVAGIVPSLLGWGAVILAVYRWDETALVLLIVAFIATIIGEDRANRAGYMPPGYIWLRWGLTAGVLLCLVSVAILRMLGGNVVL